MREGEHVHLRISVSAIVLPLVALIVSGAAAGCSTTADLQREDLAAVIERDGVPFEGPGVPAPVVDRLAQHRVVLLGETHHLKEHWELVAALVEDLHASGFRQLLVEQPQMVDWLLDDWVVDGGLEPAWAPPPQLDRMFSLVRAFNQTLPPDERVHVRSIDVNEDYFGGAEAFVGLLALARSHLPSGGPVDTFLADEYATADAQTQKGAIEALLTALAQDGDALRASWGEEWYGRVVEMAEVELDSITIRSDRRDDDEQATRAREETIKGLAERRIAELPGGTVINMGANHLQKSRLKGTDQEWLGEYLVNRSEAAGGSVFVVGFTSARTELLPGAEGTPYDIMETSPENELFRVMAEVSPGETVFLPLDDALFADRTMAVNYEETIYVAYLKRHFDAVVQYGLAHRWPSS